MTDRRRWIVTGASSGIGRAIARDAPEEGDAVVIVARRREALESLRDEMVERERELEVAVVDGDIREQDTIDRAAEAAEAFGGLDCLVNSAGGGFPSPIEEVSANAWRAIFRLNTEAVFLLSNRVFPLLRDAAAGCIVNIGSAAGWAIDPNFAPYAASKAAMHHLTRHQAVEWARYGIRANVIAPGPTAVDDNRWSTDEGREQVRSMAALGVPAEARDVVALTRFLASDDARMITGQVLNVDGGFVGWPLTPHG